MNTTLHRYYNYHAVPTASLTIDTSDINFGAVLIGVGEYATSISAMIGSKPAVNIGGQFLYLKYPEKSSALSVTISTNAVWGSYGTCWVLSYADLVVGSNLKTGTFGIKQYIQATCAAKNGGMAFGHFQPEMDYYYSAAYTSGFALDYQVNGDDGRIVVRTGHMVVTADMNVTFGYRRSSTGGEYEATAGVCALTYNKNQRQFDRSRRG